MTKPCIYCNSDMECVCRCHHLTLEDIQEAGIIGCDPIDHD